MDENLERDQMRKTKELDAKKSQILALDLTEE